MILHKILSGDTAGLYLPFGLSRLRALARTYGSAGFFQEKYSVDGYTIEVQQAPPFQYVRVAQSGGCYFEFFATGKPVSTATVTDPLSGSVKTFRAATIGTNVAVVNGAVTTKPQVLGGNRRIFTAEVSKIGQEVQVNFANEPHGLVTRKAPTKPIASPYPRLLFESWAPMHSHTGVYLRHFSRWPTNGGFASNMERDIMYDVPWADSKGVTKMRNEYLLDGAVDWPRASGVQIVTDPDLGTREFGISVDADSQVWVFPTSIAAPGDNTVDPLYVKGVSVNFPIWAFHMPGRMKDWFAAQGTTGLVEFPEIDWKLHPDGTKMCAVVYKRTSVTYDDAFFTGVSGAEGTPDTDYAAMQPTLGFLGFAFEETNSPDRYLLATGLLESTIQITLTGPNPKDFAVAGVTTVLRDPESCPFSTVLAGYVWHDVLDPYGDGVALSAQRGDLCTVDLEFWTGAGSPSVEGWVSVFGIGGGRLTMVKNFTQASADITALPFVRINDFDMQTLSFAGEMQTTSQYTLSVPIRPGYPIGAIGSGTGLLDPDDGHPHQKLPATTNVVFTVGHPQVSVFTFGKWRETLYPPGMPEGQKLTGAPPSPLSVRAGGAGFTFFPANDASTWADHANLRQWLAWEAGYSSSGTTLSSDEVVFYNQIMGAFNDLMYIAAPRFGFYYYSNQIMQIMRKQPRSILFAHPNGSWAYFDNTIVYNQNGIALGRAIYNTLDMFDITKVSVGLIDRVHLERLPGTPIDTTFVALYNQALTGSTGSNALTESFSPLSAADFTPTFTKGQYDYVIPVSTPPAYDDGKTISWLELSATYPGGPTYYTHDLGYITGAPQVNGISGSETVSKLSGYGGGQFFDLSMDAAWDSGPGYTGSVVAVALDWARYAFATPTLIVS